MAYCEQKQQTKAAKQSYLSGIEALFKRRQQEAFAVRDNYVKNIFTDPERYRSDLRKMLGWPLVDHDDDTCPLVESMALASEDGYQIYRMRFQILPEVEMTGLFFRCCSDDKKPLVIVQHGGQGTPEHIAGFYGSTTNYHDMLHRVRGKGVHVFAPQLLLWKEDAYGIDYDRQELDARLKRVGSSITAVEVYGLTRIMDYFEGHGDVSCFGMVGLSYGGFYTLMTTAVDKRIKACISCSFFNTRDEIGWSDWTWRDSAYLFDDAEIACLIYPRQLYIAIGDQDELFPYESGIRSWERLVSLCHEQGTEWVDFKVFNGKHEFFLEEEPIIKFTERLQEEGEKR